MVKGGNQGGKSDGFKNSKYTLERKKQNENVTIKSICICLNYNIFFQVVSLP